MIAREAGKKLIAMAEKFWVIALLGPRQSGKTTLARSAFAHYEYRSLENFEQRKLAQDDPNKFLAQFDSAQGVILDEIQNTPELLSYLQTKVDLEKKPGFFIITGSQNLLLNQEITQTLAGRIFILKLLPLSIAELSAASILPQEAEELIVKGSYPSIFVYNIKPEDWYENYIQTYLERDVRQIKKIEDLALFQQFIKLCAGRIGQVLNLASLANDCGISTNTARSWISVLEASFIVFLLQPHHKNFSKRIIESPKLYFYDTGLATHLLGISSSKALMTHYLRGGLFECLVISDLVKLYCNKGKVPRLYFWRDQTGNEVDCIIEKAEELIPIEIKSSGTFSTRFFAGTTFFNVLAGQQKVPAYVVHSSNETIALTAGNVVSWKKLESITE